jgi:hypothetical protein
MAEIIHLEIVTKHDISAAKMLREIAKSKPAHAFVIVWPESGADPTYHSSTADAPVVLYRIQEFIHKYYNREFDCD